MRQKILHILNYSPRGQRAIDHFLVEFAEQARNRQWEVRYAFASAPSESFARTLLQLDVHWHVVSFPLTWKSLASLFRQLDGFRPTVTQTSFISAFTPVLLLWKIFRSTRRLVVLDHSSGTVTNRGRWVELLRQVRGRLFGQVIDALVPVSHYVARRDREEVAFPAHKIYVIPNGIDLDQYPFRLREPVERLRVAYVGQLIAEKGVDLLISAVKQLAPTMSGQLEVRIAGAGRQEVELRQLAADLPEIRFLGFVDRASDVFEWADVVVVPSRWAEAFGLVAIEAMATGAVVITSDAGALPEVVGDAGVIFPAGDASALAECLASLIQDPSRRRQLGQLARKRVEECFSLAKLVTEHCQLCERIFSAK